MCGIIGYIGFRDAKEVILDSLQRLEYRGYDSAGIAMLDEKNHIICKKEVGRIKKLRETVYEELDGKSYKIGIGHTRWATHGGVTQTNAHPHMDSKNRFAVVHNGIIENYRTLKEHLEKKGHQFTSETDSEVLVHLIEEFYKEEERNLQSAVVMALKQIEGTYGIAVICTDEPYKIVGARKGSPLVVGIGEDEMLFASDVNAIMPYTRNVVIVEDGEVVVIKTDHFKTYTLDYERVEKNVETMEWDAKEIGTEGYDTFMLKEIFEQPEALRNAMRGRIVEQDASIKFGGLGITEEDVRGINRIIITACGTSWHAGLIGKYLFERFADIPTEVDYASEFRYRNPIIEDGTVVIVISQSGETADTLEALREAKRKGAKIFGLTNVVASTIAREASGGVYLHAGPEFGVASTKAFMNQVVSLAMLAIDFGRIKSMPFYVGENLIHELQSLPAKVESILSKAEDIKKIALKYYTSPNFLYLGRGFNYPVALEGALKLKEISYIHAEGYPAAEMKHGPIALIDENMPVVFIASKDPLYEKIYSNIQEVKARKGRVLAVISQMDESLLKHIDDYILVPQTIEEFSPMVNIVPLQLIAYYIAVEKGLDVDKPRNLAKSVTVE